MKTMHSMVMWRNHRSDCERLAAQGQSGEKNDSLLLNLHWRIWQRALRRGAIFAPLVLALAFASPLQAMITACGVIVAAASATAIQLWFRVQAKRSQFRRRQTSSRLATFAEAFSSIGWAATAALALVLPIAALISASMTAGILAATWKLSPRRE